MKLSRPSVTACAALACLALLAGCGGGDDSSGADDSTSASAGPSASSTTSTSASPSVSSTASDATSASASGSTGPTTSATGADFTALSGQEIADTAKATMLGLQSVHYQGSIAGGSGSGVASGQVTLDIRATAGGECTGTLGIQGGKVTVLSAGGTSYFKGDRKFWEAAAGSAADQIIAGVGDKWVLDTSQDFGQFCDLDQFLGSLFAATDGTTYQTGDTSTVDGAEVVAVQRTSTSDDPSIGYVLTGPKHYLVRIARSAGGKQGQLAFSGFDEAVDVQAPATDDIIDPATLG